MCNLRQLRYAACAIVIALAAALTEANPANARSRCVRAGEQVLAGNAQVLVVRDRSELLTWACLRRSGRRLDLDGAEELVVPARIRLNGSRVLYVLTGTDPTGMEDYTTLVLVDLKRRRKSLLAGVRDRMAPGFVSNAVVDQHGNVAAVLQLGRPQRLLLCPWRTCGSLQLPDAGNFIVDRGRIPASSLVRRGASVDWTRNGEKRSAPLDGTP